MDKLWISCMHAASQDIFIRGFSKYDFPIKENSLPPFVENNGNSISHDPIPESTELSQQSSFGLTEASKVPQESLKSVSKVPQEQLQSSSITSTESFEKPKETLKSSKIQIMKKWQQLQQHLHLLIKIQTDSSELPQETLQTVASELPQQKLQTKYSEHPPETLQTEDSELPQETLKTEDSELPQETLQTETSELPEKTLQTEVFELPQGTLQTELYEELEVLQEISQSIIDQTLQVVISQIESSKVPQEI
ncbi:110 kDa antigen-like [Procambarus clarkii]|uniref:110 kDa antigen-like n=1 Tax=Procambarus clarkii TaxID=6728 RepID=UPI003744321D